MAAVLLAGVPVGSFSEGLPEEHNTWKDLLSSDIPATFPQFVVPGKEKDMAMLRDLFYLHYPSAKVGAALWYAWIPDASVCVGISDESRNNEMAANWEKKLSEHFIDSEGYVACDMGQNVAHSLGWPFPQWNQADGAAWMFSHSGLPDMSVLGWFLEEDTAEWTLDGLQNGGKDKDSG